ncbi:MAG: NUDIX hydrolase [Planctomycetes bacterium]|nr:NUDIX hydrolase [Planctomycetota bacterium]
MAKYTYDYPRPCVTVDTVIFRPTDNGLKVLLVRRKSDPYKGMWAIPGGFVEMDESLKEAARRELEEETGVTDVEIEQLHAFGAPDRDPRTRVITVVYLAVIDAHRTHVRAGDDAAEAVWHSMDNLPELAFDHADILAMALERYHSQQAGSK